MPTTAEHSDDLKQMQLTVAQFLARTAGSKQVRTAMASEAGYDVELWRRAVEELGLVAMMVPEAQGGLGLGFTEAAMVLGELGSHLVSGPLAETIVCTAILARCNTPVAQKLLTRIAAVGLAMTAAVAEPDTGWDLLRPSVTASPVGGDGHYELLGRKAYVPFGSAAQVYLVAAAVGAETGLFAVESDASNVTCLERVGLDQTRRFADIEFSAAPAMRVDLPGSGDADRLTELMLVAIAIDSAAAARSCLDLTVEYLKVREQFGKPLGSFQALKHRCADLAVTLAGAQATAWYAVRTVAQEAAEIKMVAPLARSVCADAFMTIAAESIQLHGGIGFTFEHDAHLYFKRAKTNQQLYGSGSQLRRRVAMAAGLEN